ncbi:MAG: hypothetical protein US69_C0011G0029 [candidate division TM6 bacterium GW2011_GWF2_38_10]|nr:MAG: hypothetical protein US69_C0011G0029 [candidate division TM6 bacterium GW2011_GWF2_38_10]
MKKLALLVSASLLIPCSFVAATNLTIVSIDSLKIMQESNEGRDITAEIQKDIDSFQAQVQKSQQELMAMQEDLNKKTALLSQDALAEKTESITKKKKDLERELSDKEETLRGVIQRKQMALRDKQLKIAHEISEKEQWDMIVDKNTPGVLFASKSIDKTDVVLKAVNEKYAPQTTMTKQTTTMAKNKDAKKDIKVA